jgi:hypothetical protein
VPEASRGTSKFEWIARDLDLGGLHGGVETYVLSKAEGRRHSFKLFGAQIARGQLGNNGILRLADAVAQTGAGMIDGWEVDQIVAQDRRDAGVVANTCFGIEASFLQQC